MKDQTALPGRRELLRLSGGLALAGLLPTASVAAAAPPPRTPTGKPLRGLYPIVATPFTADDKLDTELLGKEIEFLNRGNVAGMIWPVFASSWSTLSDAERIAGAETILAAGRGRKTAIAIAVQNTAWDVPTSIRYAEHAAKHGADAIVAIPPNNGWKVSEQEILDYYVAIAKTTDLPLVVQTRGNFSVDLMIRMFDAIPTMKATKDEVGDTLARAPELLRRTNGKLAVWAAGGGSGAQLMQNLPAGIVGLCPTPQYADLLQQATNLWWAGRKREAFDMFARVQAIAAIPGATEYMLVARGVFKENTTSRRQPMEPEAPPPDFPTGGPGRKPLTGKQKQFIRESVETYLKPYFTA